MFAAVSSKFLLLLYINCQAGTAVLADVTYIVTQSLMLSLSVRWLCGYCTTLIVDIIRRVKNVEKPPFRPTVSSYKELIFTPAYYTLMEQCWHEEPTLRPDFKIILDALRSFAARRCVHR